MSSFAAGRRGLAGLFAACVLTLLPLGAAHAQTTVVKPYFMVIMDNSGSMSGSTGSGNNSCGRPRQRLNDAKCVLQQVIDGYGDVTFGLERYAEDCWGSCSFSCSTGCGCSCDWLYCGSCRNSGSGCPAAGSLADQGQILVPIQEDNQPDILEWIDYTCSTCDWTGTNPELEADSWTPIAGSLRGARRYFEGGDPTFTSPIATDAYAGCRPYNVILLTDGEETCASDAETRAAAAELRSTTYGGTTYDIRTYVIGFGVTPGTSQIEDIAINGGTDAPGPYHVYYASDEESLALAFSQIVSDSILTEECNGVDDDCDTLIDEGYTLYCDWDGTGSMPAPSLCTDPGETLCDGLDNNCDGSVDEGLLNACGTCGPPPTEVCDGLDNDCDGVIDEGGVCSGCIPSAEICDNIDNDCDGVVDEGLSRVCGTDVGVCTTGTQTCSAGTWGTCTGTGPSTETCNGLDDDCDGVTDGITRPCGSSTGACQEGTELCTGGTWGSCTGSIGPTTEICDAIDNDCDGLTDEGDPGGGGACGSAIGVCMPGTLSCVGGSLTCTGGVSPGTETCNGDDDDCDGATDEGVPTMGACGDPTGECSEGVLTCVGGSFTCVGARGPTTEVCDGRDNDCDGSTDEGNPGGGAVCGTSTGVCETGLSECLGGSLVCTGGVGPSTETCDGTDEDCDGLIDEGNPGGGAPCGATDVGECEFGAEACVGGTLVCVGETGPSTEICDGLDNDCDGMIDEGDPEGGAPCGDSTGECTPGTTRCIGGSLECDGGTGPTTEICNGLDDDCDGVVDDGIGVGAPCGTDTGECSPGLNVCRDGALECEGAIDPIPEECDLLDNDCDGLIDEDLPAGMACGTDEGTCEAGTLQCVGGRETCVGEVPPAREACDCEDNDCDGMVDEPPDTGSLCPDGASCVECQCALPCSMTEFGFTCPSGKTPLVDGDTCFCVRPRCEADTCAADTVESGGEVRCAPDDPELPSCVCKSNECTFPCDGVVCEEGLVCVPSTGTCDEPRCPVFPCAEGTVCDLDSGECLEDPCATAGCAADEACRAGTCEPSCATVSCPAGQVCEAGGCVDDPCDGVSCAAGEVCDPATGECTEDLCTGGGCAAGRVCDPVTGTCVADPCNDLRCPDGEVCDSATGECAEDVPEVDAGVGVDAGTVDAGFDAGPGEGDEGTRIIATGGGGCVCSVPGGAGAGPGPWLGLGLLGMVLGWRARRSRR